MFHHLKESLQHLKSDNKDRCQPKIYIVSSWEDVFYVYSTKFQYQMENSERHKIYDIYKGKKVLITGHTGFKGSWLTLWLKELGANVFGYALDPPTNPSLFELL